MAIPRSSAALFGLLAVCHNVAASLLPPRAHINYTIDCSTFTPKTIGKPNTCLDPSAGYGNASAWNKIIHRPLPDWYADMKLGVFIHWGAYSVPSYGTEWFWHNYECTGDGPGSVKSFADNNFPTVQGEYPKFADMFHAELYEPKDWVAAIKSAGAQYVLPVAKHHDGFCMWDASETAPMWNAAQVGPRRDVLTELYNASINDGLPFGIYYSQGEWFDADFVADARSNFTMREFVRKKLIPQRLDLVHRFNKAILWHTDGGWMAPDDYWDNLDWLTYLISESPLASKVVSCNSMGVGCCSDSANGRGGVTPQQANKCWELGDAPSGGDRTTAGSVTGHFYTNQMTLQRGSWSWDRKEDHLADFFSATELIWTLVSTTAWNGTLIMNIGPTADGRIPPVFLDRFDRLGKWLDVNGEAIYGSRPWKSALPQGSEGAKEGGFTGATNATYYTKGTTRSGCQFEDSQCKDASGVVFGIFMSYPKPDPAGNHILHLQTPSAVKGKTKASLLTSSGPQDCSWQAADGKQGLAISLPPPPLGSVHAWTVKLTGLANA